MTVEYWMQREMEETQEETEETEETEERKAYFKEIDTYWERRRDTTQKCKIVSRETMISIMRVFGGVYLDASASALEKGHGFQKADSDGLLAVEEHDLGRDGRPACQTGSYETCLETLTGLYIGQEGIWYKGGRYVFARDGKDCVICWPVSSDIANKIEELAYA